jgi:hypothetical protein
MKRLLRISGLALIGLIVCALAAFSGYRIYQHHQSGLVVANVREGDLIFQTCKSAVGFVIRDATNSWFDHLGIVTKRNGKWFVYEAIEPVVFTPLREWVERGVLSQATVMRLRDATPLASSEKKASLESAMESNAGKHYDYLLGWSDDSMYCSELVWKVFHSALGVDLCPTRRFSDFNLGAKSVKLYVAKLYKGKPPLAETVVSPRDVFDSPLLERVDLR